MSKRRHQNQRGLAAVELALAFPVVLILVGGSLVLARAYSADLRLTRLTNEISRVCSPGIGGLNGIEGQARICMNERFTPDVMPVGCSEGEIDLERSQEEFDFVDPDTGDGRTVSVPYFDFVATCRYSTIGTREVFPVLTLRAQSRMLVD